MIWLHKIGERILFVIIDMCGCGQYILLVTIRYVRPDCLFLWAGQSDHARLATRQMLQHRGASLRMHADDMDNNR